MSAALALQKAVKAAIDAANITEDAVAVPFYDAPPSDRQFPAIVMFKAGFQPLGMEDFADSREHLMTLHIYGRDQAKTISTQRIVDEVCAALDGATLTLDDPYAASEVSVFTAETIRDLDGITIKGVVSLFAHVERKA